MTPVRTALLGYGLAGRVIHRPLLQAVPDLRLTHVVTADPGRRQQVLEDLPGARLLATADDLWACAEEYDAVVVATGGTSHVPLATAALDLGKATVVDKPLAPTAAEAAGLVAHARDRGVLLTVFQNRRWDSDTLTARRLLADGTLGRPLRLESRFTRFRPEVAERWREDPAAGGGALLDLGAHLVDQAQLLLGPAVDVYAEVDAVRAGATADDDCFVALTHTSGARSHLWCSAAAPYPGPRLVLQGSAAGWAKADLDGQEAALRRGLPAGAQGPEPDGRLWTTGGERPVPSLPGGWAAFYRGFAAAVSEGAPLPVEPEVGVQVLQVLEAARDSASGRKVVRL